MLLNIADFIKRESILDTPYIGTVVDNNDPKKLGRVKCNIPELMEGTADNLPWITQKNNSLLSGSDSSFYVPKVGDKVVIEFKFGDIYTGEYSGNYITQDSKPTAFDANYPDDGGSSFSGFDVVHNRASNETKITHPSGTIINIKADGKVEILAAKIDLGSGAGESVILGDAFKAYFDTHVHPTGVGPSGPPNQPMPDSTLSQDVKTK